MRFLTFMLCLFCLFGGRMPLHALQELPFRYRQGLIWMDVSGKGRVLHFVLDSGAGESVLNLRTARELNVKLGAARSVLGVDGRTVAYRASGLNAALDGIPLASGPIAVDLSRVSRACGSKIDGLIGLDFFRNRIVQIDYKSRLIRLLDAAPQCGVCATRLPLRVGADSICVPVGVEDSRPKWTRLDTGCDAALHWVGNKSPSIPAKFASMALTANGKCGSTGKTVRVGDQVLKGVGVVFHQSAMFSGEAGLLGNGILEHYRVTIDTVSNQLFLEK